MRTKSRVSLDKAEGGNSYTGNKQKEPIADRQENRNTPDTEPDLSDTIPPMKQVLLQQLHTCSLQK